MPARPSCPRCHEPAYRAYAQVQDPETHRSTSVSIPAVFCGTAGYAGKSGKGGHGTLSVGKGQHGLVVLTPAAFAQQQRNSRSAVTQLVRKGVVRRGGTPLKPAKKPARSTGKGKAAPKAKPSRKPAKKAARKGASDEQRAADELGSE